MSKLIIDVSYHNGVINWETVKASGCAGAILRCGYGDHKMTNSGFVIFQNVKDLEFRLECTYTATQLVTDRHRANLPIS